MTSIPSGFRGITPKPSRSIPLPQPQAAHKPQPASVPHFGMLGALQAAAADDMFMMTLGMRLLREWARHESDSESDTESERRAAPPSGAAATPASNATRPSSTAPSEDPFDALADNRALMDTIEQPQDSQRFQIAMEQLGVAQATGKDDRREFGRKAEHSFIKAVHEFSLPLNRAQCFKQAAIAARLGDREPQTVDHYVDAALNQVAAHADYIANTLQSAQAQGWRNPEAKVALDTALQLAKPQPIMRTLEICGLLHSNAAHIRSRTEQVSGQYAQVNRQISAMRKAYAKQQAKAGEGMCVIC